jgi:hypothetical protein
MDEDVVCFIRLDPATAVDLNDLQFVSCNTPSNKTVDCRSNLRLATTRNRQYDSEEISFSRFNLNIGIGAACAACFAVAESINHRLIASCKLSPVHQQILRSPDELTVTVRQQKTQG